MDETLVYKMPAQNITTRRHAGAKAAGAGAASTTCEDAMRRDYARRGRGRQHECGPVWRWFRFKHIIQTLPDKGIMYAMNVIQFNTRQSNILYLLFYGHVLNV